MEDQEELIRSWVIHLGEIWILQESILENLSKDVFLEELVILSLKNLHFAKSILLLSTFIDSIRLDELLNGLKLHGPLSVFDGQSAEWVELRVLEVSESLRFGGDIWHHKPVASWQHKVSCCLLFSCSNLDGLLLAVLYQTSWKGQNWI